MLGRKQVHLANGDLDGIDQAARFGWVQEWECGLGWSNDKQGEEEEEEEEKGMKGRMKKEKEEEENLRGGFIYQSR